MKKEHDAPVRLIKFVLISLMLLEFTLLGDDFIVAWLADIAFQLI